MSHRLSGITKRARGTDPSTATVDELLGAIVGCSVIYADICEVLMTRAGSSLMRDCQDVAYTDQRIRALVSELRTRLNVKPRIPSKVNRRPRSK